MTDADVAGPPTVARRHGWGWYVGALLTLTLVALTLQSVLTLAYVGVRGDGTAGRGPTVLVTADRPQWAGGIANRLNALQGHPVRAFVTADRADARDRVARGDAVALLEFAPDRPADAIRTNSVDGGLTTAAVIAILRADEAGQGRSAQVFDLSPAGPGDSGGYVVGALVLCLLQSGFAFAAILGVWLHVRGGGFTRVRRAVGAVAVFSVAAGGLGAWTVLSLTRSLRTDWLSLAGAGTLIVAVSAAITFAAVTAFGPAGAALPALIFATVGGPYAGLPGSGSALPGATRAVVPWLPGGAGVRLVRSVLYLSGRDLILPCGVLAWWLLAALLVVFLGGANTRRGRAQVVAAQ